MVTGMEKQTKNRITRAWVGKELLEQNRRSFAPMRCWVRCLRSYSCRLPF